MRIRPSSSLLVLLLALPAGCRGPETAAPPVARDASVPSALLATVRVLEALEADAAAATPGDAASALVVRAIESDTLHDVRHPGGDVRVLLDVTVAAVDATAARERFEALAQGLPLAVPPGTDPAPRIGPERARTAFYGVGRSAWRELAEPRTEWASYSDVLPVWVGGGAGWRAEPRAVPEDKRELGAYVRSAAVAPSISIGPVELRELPARIEPDSVLHDVRIQPADPDARLSIEAIADFLFALEAGSPALAVTHLKIVRASGVTGDDFTERAWTFEAEVSFRLPRDPDGPGIRGTW